MNDVPKDVGSGRYIQEVLQEGIPEEAHQEFLRLGGLEPTPECVRPEEMNNAEALPQARMDHAVGCKFCSVFVEAALLTSDRAKALLAAAWARAGSAQRSRLHSEKETPEVV